MADPGQQKTEQPTPRRLQEARRKGQVAKSKDMTAALVLIAAVLAFYIIRGAGVGSNRHLTWYLANCLSFEVTDSGLPWVLYDYLLDEAIFFAPVLLAVIAAALAANIIQSGFLVAPEVLKPKFNRLNPIEGIKRIFSLRSLVELVKSILKILIVGAVSFIIVKKFLPGLLLVFYKAPAQGLSEILAAILAVSAAGGGVFLALAMADMFYQRWEYIKGLKMTKQEVKDEYKQTEGDPQIKGWMRRRQREIAMNRIAQEVPGATVVVTNPVHYAVALKYEEGKTEAPLVVAKGAGDLAGRIKQIAAENRVPVVENPPLARALFKQVDVGKEIPGELYQAVAEILAMVYRRNNQARWAN